MTDQDTVCSFGTSCEPSTEIFASPEILREKFAMLKNKTEQSKTAPAQDLSGLQSRRAMGILDFPANSLGISPLLIEEKLEHVPGVSRVEVNVFSKKITVQFDPSMTNLEKIRKVVTSKT